jgi:DNA-binding transcriptional LysR family regulator
MTLDQLEAFRAVVVLGTYAAASDHLHKSQPAISKLVQNLERELGLTLFDRSAYRATLTDAGRLFFERANHALATTSSLFEFGRALAGEAEALVRLVVEAVTPLSPLLEVLSTVQRVFPSVRYELRTESMGGNIEALDEGDADLAIASARHVDIRKMETEPFRSVRIVAVVRADHPLASAGSPVPGSLLRQYPQVVLRDSARDVSSPTLNVLEGGLRWTVTDVTAKLQIIEAGLGWGGLPEHVVAPALKKRRLATLDVQEFDVKAIDLHTIRRTDQPRGAVAQALWEALGTRGKRDRGL